MRRAAPEAAPGIRAVRARHPPSPSPYHQDRQRPSPGAPVTDEPDRTPPPISSNRKPRLVTALFRRYLRVPAVGCGERTNPLAGGRPEGALDEARRHHAPLLVESYRLRHPD
ncbi:hypothetical protein LRE75_36520 [Streptomyces sp. 372A]